MTHTLKGIACAVFLAASTGPLVAQEASTDALFDALDLDAIIAVMREEGLAYADTLAEGMFPSNTTGWDETASAIYDAEWMEERVRADLDGALEGRDITGMLDFFSSEPGTTIISLEVTAREAMLDEGVSDAAKETAAMARADETPRFQLIDRFVEVNDLVETNVTGAMNSNYAFYVGLMDGGAFGGELTEDQILSDVWAQEPEIRQSTTEWVYGFFALAYQPLSDEDLEAYIAFAETEDGKALNRALFQAFDPVFVDIARALGRACAERMVMQEL
jgi:hypothetical protein